MKPLIQAQPRMAPAVLGEDWLLVLTADDGKDLRRPDPAPSHLPDRQMEPCSGEGACLPWVAPETGARVSFL